MSVLIHCILARSPKAGDRQRVGRAGRCRSPSLFHAFKGNVTSNKRRVSARVFSRTTAAASPLCNFSTEGGGTSLRLGLAEYVTRTADYGASPPFRLIYTAQSCWLARGTYCFASVALAVFPKNGWSCHDHGFCGRTPRHVFCDKCIRILRRHALRVWCRQWFQNWM